MKRIASILFSWLALMPVCMASRAFVVTSEGVEVEDGSVVEVGYTAIRKETAALVKWAPLLEIRAVSGESRVTVEVSSGNSGFQICWPNVCREVVAGELTVVESTVGESPENMHIENSRIVLAGNEVGESEAVVVVRDDEDETLMFTIRCIDKDLAGVENVMADGGREEISRFSVGGRSLCGREKGVNIVRYSDGTVAKVVEK